jgi:integrase
MTLAKLGLRASEVATLTLDDVDWRSGEMLIRAKGRQRAKMPLPPEVGAAVVTYLRDGRPRSSCRRLFLRTLAPHVGFASGCAITMIAKTALERAGIRGYAHQGAHIFRHSLATELLRSGATLPEIGYQSQTRRCPICADQFVAVVQLVRRVRVISVCHRRVLGNIRALG